MGHTPFRFLDLAVGPGVFIPRPETESVVQAGLDWLAGEQTTRERLTGKRHTAGRLEEPLVVDLCAGSGAIGLAVATEVSRAQVWAVEASEEAAVWTRRNYERYRPDIEAHGSKYHLILGDAASAATLTDLDGQVDLLISNPPYVPESQVPTQPEVAQWDPPQALYGASADGTALPRRIISRAASLLRPGGCFVMEHDPSQSQTLRECAQAVGFSQSSTGQDMTGRDRYLFAIR